MAKKTKTYGRYTTIPTMRPSRLTDSLRAGEDRDRHPPLGTRPVELDQDHALPRPEQQVAVANRDRLRGAEDRGLDVGLRVVVDSIVQPARVIGDRAVERAEEID